MTDDLLDEPVDGRVRLGLAIGLGLIVIAGGGWYYWHTHGGAPAPAPVIEQPTADIPASAPPARIEHPLPTAAPAEPLPDLNDSDKPIGAALAQAVGAAPIATFLVPDSIIRHIVVTVDNLPRQKVAADKRPLVPTPGELRVRGDELHATLDAQNYSRYAPLIEALRHLDMQRVADVYLHFYPLFQSAYQDLGYPNGYFNDRLVQAIDDLLATPQVSGPIDLVRPNVLYVYADQTLESRSAGQKLLIRMGADNAAAVKAKLTELRAIITVGVPKH